MKTGSKLSDFNHYGGGMTQREVASVMGCPYQSIQQTEKRAIAKFIKNYFEMFGMPDFNNIIEAGGFDYEQAITTTREPR